MKGFAHRRTHDYPPIPFELVPLPPRTPLPEVTELFGMAGWRAWFDAIAKQSKERSH